MKYKVGDRVRVRKDLKAGEPYKQDGEEYAKCMVTPSMAALAGKVVTIVSSIHADRYRVGGSPFSWTDDMFEGLATESAPKYKVGDRVIIEKSNIETITHHKGLVGVIEKVWNTPDGHDYWVLPEKKGVGAAWCRVRCLAPSKIVVTTDGKTTTARLFSGKELVKTATAKCSPQDAFVFETGAAIALDRLLDREEKAEPEAPKFTKADLKDGMFCRLSDGSWFVIVGNRAVCSDGYWMPMADLREDLTWRIAGAIEVVLDGVDCFKAAKLTSSDSRFVKYIRPGVKF